MFALELAAAISAMATAAQPATLHHTTAAHKPVAKRVDHAAACRKAHGNYDARTGTYRDARGKRQRCTL